MDYFNIPDWAKKYGTLGLVLFIMITLLVIFIEAILQQEAQSIWNTEIKPWLAYDIKINFALPIWLLGFIVLFVSVSAVAYFVWTRRTPHLKKGMINPSSLPLPKESDSVISKSQVFRAVKEARSHKLDEQDMAKIIEQAVNLGVIKEDVGVEILSEFGYALMLNLDKTRTAIRWVKK